LPLSIHLVRFIGAPRRFITRNGLGPHYRAAATAIVFHFVAKWPAGHHDSMDGTPMVAPTFDDERSGAFL
jgi:hypothetical protein